MLTIGMSGLTCAAASLAACLAAHEGMFRLVMFAASDASPVPAGDRLEAGLGMARVALNALILKPARSVREALVTG